MGILKRIRSLMTGFAQKATGRLESRNPDLLIADAENRIYRSRKEAEKQLIEIQTWTEMIRLDMREAETSLDDTRDKIQLAVSEGDKDLLTELIMQEEDLKNHYYSRKDLFDNAVAEAIRVRDSFKQFEAQMNEKMRMLKNIKSQAQLVELRERIVKLDDQYGFFDTSTTTRSKSELQESLDRLRLSINERSARVMVTEQLRKENTAAKVTNLEYNVRWKKANERAASMLEGGTQED